MLPKGTSKNNLKRMTLESNKHIQRNENRLSPHNGNAANRFKAEFQGQCILVGSFWFCFLINCRFLCGRLKSFNPYPLPLGISIF